MKFHNKQKRNIANIPSSDISVPVVDVARSLVSNMRERLVVSSTDGGIPKDVAVLISSSYTSIYTHTIKST